MVSADLVEPFLSFRREQGENGSKFFTRNFVSLEERIGPKWGFHCSLYCHSQPVNIKIVSVGFLNLIRLITNNNPSLLRLYVHLLDYSCVIDEFLFDKLVIIYFKSSSNLFNFIISTSNFFLKIRVIPQKSVQKVLHMFLVTYFLRIIQKQKNKNTYSMKETHICI